MVALVDARGALQRQGLLTEDSLLHFVAAVSVVYIMQHRFASRLMQMIHRLILT
jgi:hypothetical protein